MSKSVALRSRVALTAKRLGSEARSLMYPESDPFSIPPPGSVGNLSGSGVLINDHNALGIVTVLAACRILADAVSGLSLKVFTASGTIRQEVLTPPAIAAEPFTQANRIEGFEQWMMSLLLRGNAYAVITARDANLRAAQMFVVHPDSMDVKRNDAGAICYTVNGIPVPTTDVVHIKHLIQPGHLLGVSVIENARNAFGLTLAAEEYGSMFFRNGASMSGVIEVPEGLDETDARRMKEDFVAKHSGLRNAHLPAVLTGGAQWKSISITPDDAQFIAVRQYQDSQIATLFGIPPHLLGMVDRTTSWGTGIEIQGRAFVDYTLRPYLARFEHVISTLLPPGMWAEFDTDQLTRADTATRFANYTKSLQGGWACVDEIRRNENLPPLPNGTGQVFRNLSTLVPSDSQAPDDDDLPLIDPEDPGAGAPT